LTNPNERKKEENKRNSKEMRSKWLFLILVGLIWSCSKPSFFNKYNSLKDNKWALNQAVTFDVNITDTINPVDAFINLRNNNQYPYSNIYLIVTSRFNHTIFEIDTLEYEMADASGRWLGSGFTDVKENKLVFKTNYVFSKKGTYQFSIKHADRKTGQVLGDAFLPGLTDVGFEINYKNK
jgi:gliding motility-associated lipoprotein GldH